MESDALIAPSLSTAESVRAGPFHFPNTVGLHMFLFHCLEIDALVAPQIEALAFQYREHDCALSPSVCRGNSFLHTLINVVPRSRELHLPQDCTGRGVCSALQEQRARE